MRKANRYRPHQIHVMMTEEEYGLIKERAQDAKIGNLSAYMRKMAIDGYVINVKISEISEAIKLLRYSSNNINQIARHANETGSVYKSDIEDIKENYDKLWDSMKDILKQLNEIVSI